MTITSAIRCDACTFYLKIDEQQGDCRRYPCDTENKWPRVDNEDWCGEFKPAPAGTVAEAMTFQVQAAP